MGHAEQLLFSCLCSSDMCQMSNVWCKLGMKTLGVVPNSHAEWAPYHFHGSGYGSGLSPNTWENIENKKEEHPKLRPLVVAMKIHDNLVQNDNVLKILWMISATMSNSDENLLEYFKIFSESGTHSRERLFTCKECFKLFSETGSLKRKFLYEEVLQPT